MQGGAIRASQALVGVWAMEEETRSSVYATAQTIVWPWADPGVAAARSSRPATSPSQFSRRVEPF